MVIKRPQSIAEQAAAILRARIYGREYGDERLPSESVLAAEMGVSRATIRTALSRLEAESLVTRKQGDGTYINQRIRDVKTHIGEIWEFTHLIRTRGHEPSIRPLGIFRRLATQEEAGALCLDSEEEVVSVNRLFLSDNHPFVLSENVMPFSLVQKNMQELDATYSLHDFTARYSGYQVVYAIARIVSITASEEIGSQLAVEPGFPLLQDIEIFYGGDEQPLVYANNYYNDKVIDMRLIRYAN